MITRGTRLGDLFLGVDPEMGNPTGSLIAYQLQRIHFTVK
jgi:hypothetical protein